MPHSERSPAAARPRAVVRPQFHARHVSSTSSTSARAMHRRTTVSRSVARGCVAGQSPTSPGSMSVHVPAGQEFCCVRLNVLAWPRRGLSDPSGNVHFGGLSPALQLARPFSRTQQNSCHLSTTTCSAPAAQGDTQIAVMPRFPSVRGVPAIEPGATRTPQAQFHTRSPIREPAVAESQGTGRFGPCRPRAGATAVTPTPSLGLRPAELHVYTHRRRCTGNSDRRRRLWAGRLLICNSAQHAGS